MSSRDKELKESFMELFSQKLRDAAPSYFSKKRDPVVGDMSFSDEELEEIELEVKNILLTGVEENENSED